MPEPECFREVRGASPEFLKAPKLDSATEIRSGDPVLLRRIFNKMVGFSGFLLCFEAGLDSPSSFGAIAEKPRTFEALDDMSGENDLTRR